MKSRVKFTSKTQDSLEATLEWLVKNVTISTDGKSMQMDTFNLFMLDISQLLYGMVEIVGATPSNTKLTVQIAMPIFLKQRLVSKSPFYKDDFRIALEESINIVEKGMKEYQLVAFVNFNPSKLIPYSPLQCGGGRILFENPSIAEDELSKLEYELRGEINLLGHEPFLEGSNLRLTVGEEVAFLYPIVIKVSAYSDYTAFSIATESLEVLLGALNFMYVRNSSRIHLSNIVRLSPIVFPNVLALFDQEGKFKRVYTYDGWFWDPKPIELQETYVKMALNLIQYIDSSVDLGGVLEDALMFFQRATTETDPFKVFLHLWQCLEVICLDSHEQKKNVSSKIINLLEYSKTGLDAGLIKIIENTRHSLVHGARDYPNDITILLSPLKHFVTNAILALFTHRDSITTKFELEEYLSNITSSEEELRKRQDSLVQDIQKLESRKRVIDFINSTRLSNKK